MASLFEFIGLVIMVLIGTAIAIWAYIVSVVTWLINYHPIATTSIVVLLLVFL